MKRTGRDVPTGVFILSGLAFIRGFYAIMLGLIAIFDSFVTAIIMLVLGALLILCGSWLISLQPRGWMLATVGSGLFLLLALANISLNGSSYGRLAYAVIAAIILVYLNLPATKRVFGR